MSNATSHQEHSNRILETAIIVLLVLTSIMLAALFSRTQPHPPFEVTPFAIAPFLGSSLAIGAASLYLARINHRHAFAMSLIFVVTALISFGPQKYFDEAITRIWPTIVCAQISIIIIYLQCLFNKSRHKHSRQK